MEHRRNYCSILYTWHLTPTRLKKQRNSSIIWQIEAYQRLVLVGASETPKILLVPQALEVATADQQIHLHPLDLGSNIPPRVG